MTKNRADNWAAGRTRGIYWKCGGSGGSARGPVGKRAVESGPGLWALGSGIKRRWNGGTRYKVTYLLVSCYIQYLLLVTLLVLLQQLHRKVKARSGCPWRGCAFPFLTFPRVEAVVGNQVMTQ